VRSVNRSINSLRRAGCNDWIFVSSDGPVYLTDDNVLVNVNDPPKGVLKHWFFALQWILGHRDRFDWILMLQDDVTWSKKGWEVLLEELQTFPADPETVGFVSLYLHRTTWGSMKSSKVKKPGIYEAKARGSYKFDGALALAIPRTTAELLVHDPEMRKWHRNRNIDNVVEGRLAEYGFRNFHRIPSLVNHKLGSGNSTIKRKSTDDTPRWEKVAQVVEWREDPWKKLSRL